MADDLRVLLGLGIRARRDALGLSQGDLATRLGWPQPRVSEVERGRSWPPPERLAALAVALECEPGDLLRADTPAA